MAFSQDQVGTYKAQGVIWMNTANWTGSAIVLGANTYKEVSGLGTGFTLQPISDFFSMTSDGQLKYTGSETKRFNLRGYVAHANTGQFAIALYKNGSIIPGTETYTNNTAWLTSRSAVELATNDYVSIYIKRTSALSPALYQATLSAKLTEPQL